MSKLLRGKFSSLLEYWRLLFLLENVLLVGIGIDSRHRIYIVTRLWVGILIIMIEGGEYFVFIRVRAG
jgi:hypothetical protein